MSLHEQVLDFLGRVFPTGRIRRVLLVTPPDADPDLFRFDTAQRRRYTNYPPYGLLVIAHHLEAIGVEVRICNLNHHVLKKSREARDESDFAFDAAWREELDNSLDSFKPELVGVTCMFTMTHASFKSVCQRVSDKNYPVAIGGVHVTNGVERILDDVDVAQIAFLREGENAIKSLVQVVNGEADVSQLGQVILVEEGKRLRLTDECQPNEADISIIPAYHLIDISAYSDHGTIGAFYCFKPEGTKFASVLSSRGCRGQCTFCSVRNFNGQGVRQRSVSSVVDEIQCLQNDYGISHIMWLDDDLFKDHKRTVALFNELVRRDLSVTWDATNGVIASSCTDEVISAAAASGCIAINIGLESGNPQILKSVRKPGTVKIFQTAAEVLRRYEQIHTSAFLMIGFPNETMAMIMDTIKLAQTMDLDWYRISQLQPLPNTPIHDAMAAAGLVEETSGMDLRFNGGAYGKQTEIEQGLHLATADFAEAFSAISLDAVPSAEQLTDIWFFMNYHLNFHRIFGESRAEKISQLVAHLNVLADVISPENGFALYFLGYLKYLDHGAVGEQLIGRLEDRLETSPYWRDRFQAFDLSVDQLREGDFSRGEAPDRLLKAVGA